MEKNISTPSWAIELVNINKSFGAVHANKNISLRIPPGEIFGIIGENGAGKSTLMSILYGFYEADSGKILINGNPVYIHNSKDAIKAGIGMVHQHFMLVETFTALENIMLGAEKGIWLPRGEKRVRHELKRLSQEYGLEVNPNAIVERLPVGQQQRVEILKALFRKAKILILDEPTGVLTPQEADQLFSVLKHLKKEGVTVIIITHKLREIMAITENVAVMRRGQIVAQRKTAQTSVDELAELMVGRKVEKVPRPTHKIRGKCRLEVRNLSFIDENKVPRLKNINFSLYEGEIVGVAGVSGNGQETLLSILSGALKPTTGSYCIEGKVIDAHSNINPKTSRDLGMGYIPQDRHHVGMVTKMPAYENAILGQHRRRDLNAFFLMKKMAIFKNCRKIMKSFDVRPLNIHLKSANFSGGNQQKLIIGRELSQNPKVLLIGQPTRGVDIGAIESIHKEILGQKENGAAILLISAELEEILTLSDRILVICAGSIVGEILPKDADEKKLGLMMANINIPSQQRMDLNEGEKLA